MKTQNSADTTQTTTQTTVETSGTLGNRRWLLLAVLMLGIAGLAAAGLMGRSAGASVEGKVQGHASTLEFVSGEPITGLNGLGFPPGGTLKKPLASTELGGALSITSTTAQVDCGGNSTGTDSVNTHCISQATGLVIAVNGQTLLTADSLVAEARATGVGDSSNATPDATKISGLCVVTVAGQPCIALADTRDGTAAIAGTGVTGSVTVHQQFDRTQNVGVPGSGITTVALEVELNISGHGTVQFRIGVADAFVGTVRTCGVPAYETPTETPTKTPTPALEAVPTPTCAPTATGTPQLKHYGASAPQVAKD